MKEAKVLDKAKILRKRIASLKSCSKEEISELQGVTDELIDLLDNRDDEERKLIDVGKSTDVKEKQSREEEIEVDLTVGENDDFELADLIDKRALQSLMDKLYEVTGAGIAIVDKKGNVLVTTGWQDICTKFHRIHPETKKKCIESDVFLSKNVKPGEFKAYKCKNNMWDIATPIFIDGKHLGNIFLGQFLYKDEEPDYEAFREQAKNYGFDEKEYIEALDRVPRWDRDFVNSVMTFYSELSNIISSLSYSNIKLSVALGELNRAQEGLKDERAFLSAVFDTIEESIILCDEEGRLTRFNDAARKLHGLPERSIKPDKWADYYDLFKTDGKTPLPKEEIPLFRALNGEKVRNAEIVVLPENKEIRYLECNGELLTNEKGEKTGALITMHDVTERKKVEETLKKNETLLQNMLNAIPDMVSVHDSEMNIRFSNWRGYGAVPKEARIIGSKCYKTYRGYDKICPDCQAKEVLETRKEFQREFELPDGTWVDLRVIPIFDMDGECNLFVEWVRDITDRKRVEKAIRDSEEKYRTIFNESPYGILLSDLKEVVDANNSFYKLTGYSEKEIIGCPIYRLPTIPQKKMTFYLGLLKQAFQGKKIEDFEFEWLHKSGEKRYGKARLSMIKGKGKSKVLQAILEDITERKKAEEALKESVEFQKALFGWNTDPLTIIDLEDKVIDLNPAFEKLFGYSLEELKGKVFPGHIGLDEGKFEEWREKCRKGMGVSGYETVRQTKSGELIDVSISISPIKDHKGDFKAMSFWYRDISERKRAETQIQESEERLRDITDNMKDVVWRTDLDMNITYVSPSVEHTLGTPIEEHIKSKPEERHPPTSLQKMRELLKEELERDKKPEVDKNRSRIIEVEEYSADGIINIEMHVSFIRDSDGNPIGIQGIERDITDRKRAEKQLQESEERFKKLSSLTFEGVIIHDKGVVIDVNDSFSNMTGYSRNELIGENLIGLCVPSEYHDIVKDNIIKKRAKPYEITAEKKDGTLFPVEIESRDVMLQNEEFRVTAIRNISERKEAEQALRESEEKLRTYIHSTNDFVVLKDENFRHTMVNKAYLDFLNAEEGDVLGKTDFELLPKELAEKCLESDKKALSEGKQVTVKEKFGENVFESRKFPVRLKDNSIGIGGLIRDVTEIEIAQKALRESEERFRKTFEQTAVGIAHVSPEGRIIRLNQRFCEIIGYSEEDALNMNFMDITHPEDKNLNEPYIEKQLDNKLDSFRMEKRYIHKSGRTLWVNKYSSAVRNDSGDIKYLVIAIDDITNRKKAEAELQRISKLESLGTLAGGIAHNFKNILASVSLNTGLARIKPKNMDKYLDRIESSIDQASALANRFQTFTKGGEPVKEPTDIRKVIEEAESMALSGSNCAAEKDYTSDLWTVNADPKQINETFMNLLINAKQAMPRGGKIFIQVESVSLSSKDLAELPTGDYIKITIEDEGLGIPKDDLKFIFDPFYTTKEKGQGLGLSSVHFIIQKHGGHIKVYSELGEGTTFNIYLPAAKETPERTEEIKEDVAMGEFDKVLIMDDEEDIRENIIEIGEALDYKIAGAKNGEEAIAMYKEALNAGEPYSVVILDLTIRGGMGGDEAVEELKKIDPNVKAIVFSGYSNKPVVANYEEYGFAAKLNKPIKVNQLAKTLREIIDSELKKLRPKL